MSLAKTLIRVFIDSTIIVAVILFVPGLPPSDNFEAITVAPSLPLEGALHPKNYALNNVERLFKGRLHGPEGLAESPDEPGVFFTSTIGGSVVKIYDDATKMKSVAHFGEKCHWEGDPEKCGRPLGIRFDRDGHLIASDSYLGIYKVDLSSGKTTNLVPKLEVVEGKVSKFFNSVAPAEDGKIYYTLSSTRYALGESLGEVFGVPSGRLMVYDPATRKSKVLKDDIHFTNGIILSPDEDFLVFAECMRYRLHKYYITGPKAGKSEVFLDGLPGSPDNLSLSPDGNILVTLVVVRLPGQFNPTEFMYNHPWLRKIFLRVLHLIRMPLEFASSYLDLPVIRQISSHVLSFTVTLPVMPPGGIVIEIDWNGKIVNSWHSNKWESTAFSEAKIINGYLYVGSPFNDYLGRIKLPK